MARGTADTVDALGCANPLFEGIVEPPEGAETSPSTPAYWSGSGSDAAIAAAHARNGECLPDPAWRVRPPPSEVVKPAVLPLCCQGLAPGKLDSLTDANSQSRAGTGLRALLRQIPILSHSAITGFSARLLCSDFSPGTGGGTPGRHLGGWLYGG